MRGIALIVRAGAVVCASAFVLSLVVHGAPRPAVASTEAAKAETAASAKAATQKRSEQKAKAGRAAAKVPPARTT